MSCCRCRRRYWNSARTIPHRAPGWRRTGEPTACAMSSSGPGDRGGACRPGTRRSSASHPVGRSCASCCGRCRPTDMDIGIADPAWGAAEEDTPHVALAGFEGTLALLVELARTHQIDLSQLPVAEVVDQLMAALQHAGPAITLGRKGDWVVLAAWLLLLRSRLLLPVETLPPDAADTAGQLRDRLIALQAAQALAAWLDRRSQLGHEVFARGQPELLGTSTSSQYEVDVIEFLWACAAQFDDDAAPVDIATVYRPPWHDLYSVLDARTHILRLLASDHLPLERFLPDAPSEDGARLPLWRRSAVASTLVAGLELARDGVVRLHQEGAFAAITLSARAEPAGDQGSAAAA